MSTSTPIINAGTLADTCRMICADIDGTLLNKDKWLSDNTIEQIQRVTRDYKIPFILVSSRMPKAMRHLQDAMNHHQPIICYNGALIQGKVQENGTVQTLLSKTIPLDFINFVHYQTRNTSIHTSLYQHDCWYDEQYDEWTEREVRNTKVEPEIRNRDKVLAEWEQSGTGAHKIMLMGPEEEIGPMESRLREHPEVQNSLVKLYRTKRTYIEISPAGTSKAEAIKYLAGEMNFSAEHVLAFGDNYNDVEMLEAAGYGVVVDNAPDAVKQVADDVTLHHKEDGVAEALKKYF